MLGQYYWIFENCMGVYSQHRWEAAYGRRVAGLVLWQVFMRTISDNVYRRVTAIYLLESTFLGTNLTEEMIVTYMHHGRPIYAVNYCCMPRVSHHL